MMTKLDEVIETVLRAREDGPESLAAVAMSFGAAMELGTLGNTALKARLAEARAALEATEATVATLRHERDAAHAEAKAARESADDAQADAARLRALVDAARDERDRAKAARESVADTAEVWRLRESVTALRADIARVAAERDEARSIAAMRDRALTVAVQERESFSLRLSAAERERDAALARPTYEARTTAPTQAECDAHEAAGGVWYVTGGTTLSCVVLAHASDAPSFAMHWIAMSRDGLPCAWPVVAAEGGA